MANHRLIRPGFFVNPGVSMLTIKERYLLIGLTAVANDWGKFWFQPNHIRSQVFPTDEIEIEEMNAMLDNVVSKGFICLYGADKVKYAHFPTWRQQGSFLMQYLDKPRPDVDIPDCPEQHDEVVLRNFSESSGAIEKNGKEKKRIVSKGEKFSKEKSADIKSQVHQGLLNLNRNKSKMIEIGKKFGYEDFNSLDFEMKKCEAHYVKIQQVPEDFEAAFENWLIGKIRIAKKYSKS